MSIISMFSKLSGWYRLLIVSTAIWIIGALITTNPWTRYGRRSGGNWDEFLLIGVLPIVIFWGIIWIVHGFKKGRKKDEYQNESRDNADKFKNHSVSDDTGQEKIAERLQKNEPSEVNNETNKNENSSDQIVEPSPKKPTTISNILYYLIWITLLSFIFMNLALPREVTRQDALYAPIWVAILAAWTAKRKGKSGWLWFFIGLFIGCFIIFLLIIDFLSIFSKQMKNYIKRYPGFL